jgi:diacylglycerol kinase (ATP)
VPKPLIIVNNVAAKAKLAWPLVRAKLITAGIQFDVHQTVTAGDATGRTRAALNAGCELIAVVGGDGTLSEAAEGFFEPFTSDAFPKTINPSACLAVLPAGTGDDFARGLAGRRFQIEPWIDLLVGHLLQRETESTKLVDVLAGASNNYTHRFVCLNASTMGIGGETASRVSAQGKLIRNFSGGARFMVGAAGALMKWRERRVRITVDNVEMIDGPANLVAVANGLYAGGGMMLSPDARPDDGKLDVVSVSGLSRVEVMREMTRIHSGGHVANPKVRVQQGTEVKIETFDEDDALLIEADGNLRGRTPVEFKVMPRALRVISPAR